MRVLLDQGLAPRAAKLLRNEGWDAGQAHLIRAIVDKCRGALTAGAAVSADLVNIRIRPLPLRGTDLE